MSADRADEAPNASLPYIEGGIGTGGVYGTWISTAYLIGEIIVIPLTNFLSQVFSLRRYLLANVALFLLFSALCGQAHSLGEMIAFRALYMAAGPAEAQMLPRRSDLQTTRPAISVSRRPSRCPGQRQSHTQREEKSDLALPFVVGIMASRSTLFLPWDCFPVGTGFRRSCAAFGPGFIRHPVHRRTHCAKGWPFMNPKRSASTAATADPCCFVIFGALGDLTHRLLVPALYNLAAGGLLPEAFSIIGVARSEMSDEAFRTDMAKGLRRFGTGKIEDDVADRLLDCVSYVNGTPGAT